MPVTSEPSKLFLFFGELPKILLFTHPKFHGKLGCACHFHLRDSNYEGDAIAGLLNSHCLNFN